MKLFRVSEENAAPEWTYASNSLDQYEKEDAINADQLNCVDKSYVNEEILSQECNKIEQCASSGNKYYYNAGWKDSHISHLKEYALACGMNLKKFCGVSPILVAKDSGNSMTRTASTAVNQKLQDALGDPFHFEKLSDTSHMDKSDWEKVNGASKLSDKPSMKGFNAIRGSEDYSINVDVSLANNQNSITKPNAIEELANRDDSILDNGVRLCNEAKAREAGRKSEHATWEKEIVDSMVHKNIIPKGHVYQTGSGVANTGMQSKASQMANIDEKDIPEFTQGEKLAQSALDRKESIQRKKEAKEWDSDGSSSYRSISEDFSKSLAAKLGKK